MNTRSDQDRRAAALDPTRSFIVEAPAGSGKTELLIQRYLRLLACVERPEQVVAITFTRKAAAEMRQRVVATLDAAHADEAEVPKHRQTSLALARDVLAHAYESGWESSALSGRLKITTIDALNVSLAQRLPIAAGGFGSLQVTDRADHLYRLAAQRTTEGLASSDDLGRALRILLMAADNSLEKLERWLAAILPGRDSWLAIIRDSDAPLADTLGKNLDRLRRFRLQDVENLVSTEAEQRLRLLLDELPAGNAAEDEDEIARRTAFWLRVRSLFLKTDGDWRQRFTRADGFPAEDKHRRQELSALRGILQSTPMLRERLLELSAIPAPSAVELQRAPLGALQHVLPRLLAELRVLFEEQGVTDHTEIALSAEHALGTVDAPSELLLALDRRIEHVLVDEFQDTSQIQWRLFELLTSGWERGDGRTLFLVGDPMQSIYAFRDADPSLFLRAQRQGIGAVELHTLELTENYRSAADVVSWVNKTFARLLATTASLPVARASLPADTASYSENTQSLPTKNGASGFPMPRYRAATPMVQASAASGVHLHFFESDNESAEVERVVAIVEDALAIDRKASIGILVRSRRHLLGIRTGLRSRGLRAHALEIDSLSDSQFGQDLIGLAGALLHRADRLSWLGVLRSPWCGLSWADLLEVSADRDRTIWENIQAEGCIERLSEEGRKRLTWLRDRLIEGFRLRSDRSLGQWVRDCWLLIDGPAVAANAQEIELAESFFDALQTLAQFGEIDDPASLRKHFSQPLKGTADDRNMGVEIMTMHRAKGLEFDIVILPSLARTVLGYENKLLNYQAISAFEEQRITLLAARQDGPDPVGDYLKRVRAQADAAERCRLLYVAATRARRQLHLVGSIDPKRGRPASSSLLGTLWKSLDDQPKLIVTTAVDKTDTPEFVTRPLRRLALQAPEVRAPIRAADVVPATAARLQFQWVNPASVQVGTLIHRELQRLTELAARAGRPVPPEIDTDRYRRSLALLGVDRADLTAGSRRVAQALEQVWADPTGRWILKPRPEAWSELRLTVRGANRLEHVQLDRCFIDDEGICWIIDYKTGRHLGGDREGFLDTEVERYRDQLERYARALSETETRPIRLGLYFPLMAELRAWDASATRSAVND